MGSFFILTGGPCAGKTTLLAELRRRGHPVIPEAARAVILEGQFHPSRDPLEFQRAVLRRQVSLEEASLRETGVEESVFVDRAIGDHFGYLEHYRNHCGLDLLQSDFQRELLEAWEKALGRYAAVFLLEQNPDYVSAVYRRESAAQALAIHQALASAYRSRHPRVLNIPWCSLEKRVEEILAAVGKSRRCP